MMEESSNAKVAATQPPSAWMVAERERSIVVCSDTAIAANAMTAVASAMSQSRERRNLD